MWRQIAHRLSLLSEYSFATRRRPAAAAAASTPFLPLENKSILPYVKSTSHAHASLPPPPSHRPHASDFGF